MPTPLTYPGVYIEEVSSGVRTITGVATSITAFVGRTLRGPINEPVSITSYGDFERVFGGLWEPSALSFAVRDFFVNGGAQALVVRLYRKDDGGGAKPEVATIDATGLKLVARGPGAWGNKLRARVDYATKDPDSTELFNLTVHDTGSGQIEQFLNLSTEEASARRVDRVLHQESTLVEVAASGFTAGTRPDEHDPLDPKKDTWADDGLSTGVAGGGEASEGQPLDQDEFTGTGKEGAKEGLFALEKADLFNLLCLPPYLGDGTGVDTDLISQAAAYCEKRRAFLIVDPPTSWTSKATAVAGINDTADKVGTRSKNAALFFPRLRQPNPTRDGQLDDFAPCGAVAGVIARTDAQRGVWKAPAGLDAALVGVPQLSVPLTDAENGELNPIGVNCLRAMPAAGRVVWGSRTLQGADRLASEWKYLPVRRTALFLEESLYRGTQWVVFEPNDEPLWAQIRLNVGAFMHSLFLQGAFAGTTRRDAYFVKCDSETTTQTHVNLGIVNVVVGFAPLKPAEFVVIKLQQMAGQITT